MGEAIVIAIGSGDDFDAGDAGGNLCVVLTLASGADDCDLDLIIGGDGLFGLGLLWREKSAGLIRLGRRVKAGDEQRLRGCGSGDFQKASAIHVRQALRDSVDRPPLPR